MSISLNAQVGVGTITPVGALDITSNDDGLLIPRVALSSTLVVLPVITGTESELVYNTATVGDVTPGFYYLSTATGPWLRLGVSSGWQITGNADIIDGRNFLGTTNNIDVAFRRNNMAAGELATTSTSFGVGALNSGADTNNTAIGHNALGVNTGADNTALGKGASAGNTTGIQNTAVGVDALTLKTTGSANTAIGWNALAGAGTYSNVTALGFQAGSSNTASNATLIGFQTGNANTADNFIAIGFQAGSNNAGLDNIAIGSNALDNHTNSASRSNVAIGSNAMGGGGGVAAHNVAIGDQAAQSLQSSNNIAIGRQTMLQTTSGNGNVAVGDTAMLQGNSSQNTAVGKDALMQSPGNSNVAVGYQAGMTTPGSNNVFVGWQANGTGTTTNAIAIGFQADAPASNAIRIGNTSITLAQTAVAWTLISDRRMKSNILNSALGLEFVKTLRPVSYFKNTDENKKTEYGFIAQEVEIALNNVGDKNNGLVYKDAEGNYSLRYNDFIPMTVKAIQEQQVLIEKLQSDNAELKAVNTAILKRLEALENSSAN